MASTDVKPKGTWIHRFAIRFFTLVFAILVYWVLGFLVDDIQDIPGPSYPDIEESYVDQDLAEQRDSLLEQIAVLNRTIANQTERQKVIGDSSQNLQQTIEQMIDLQRIGMENNIAFSGEQQENFTESIALFLDSQRRYQELSQAISDNLERKQELSWELDPVQKQIDEQRFEASQEYSRRLEKHRVRLALLQLAILLPILAIAAIVLIKKRSSIYFPLFLAFGAAALIKITLVIHEYFPTRYFKYIVIGAMLIVVARLLIYFIRTIAFPKAQWLVKQYREAYERFLCPVCEYPIRIGPRRFLFWTRRTVNKIVVPTEQVAQEEKYTCPSCGTTLFEECPKCHEVRHAMLPNCRHCGDQKEIV